MKNKKISIYGVLAIIFIAGLFFGFRYYNFLQTHEETDDAQIDGNIVPVIARVGSYVNKVYVEDNQLVKRGTLAAELDTLELSSRLSQAVANFEAAKATVGVVQSNTKDALKARQLASTSIESPKTNLWKAQKEYQRYSELFEQHLATPQQIENMKANLENAESQYQLAIQKHEASGTQYETALQQVKVAEANVNQRLKDVEYARLQISYTKIFAPVDGTISKKSIQPGQLIQAGQPLMAIVQNNDLWVTGNFKETQLEGIKVGNAVDIEVDAYPSLKVTGKVESVGGATGAKFSLLPPDNASGNFVKVVQRVPVRIAVNRTPETAQLLKPGLSVKVTVTK